MIDSTILEFLVQFCFITILGYIFTIEQFNNYLIKRFAFVFRCYENGYQIIENQIVAILHNKDVTYILLRIISTLTTIRKRLCFTWTPIVRPKRLSDCLIQLSSCCYSCTTFRNQPDFPLSLFTWSSVPVWYQVSNINEDDDDDEEKINTINKKFITLACMHGHKNTLFSRLFPDGVKIDIDDDNADEWVNISSVKSFKTHVALVLEALCSIWLFSPTEVYFEFDYELRDEDDCNIYHTTIDLSYEHHCIMRTQELIF